MWRWFVVCGLLCSGCQPRIPCDKAAKYLNPITEEMRSNYLANADGWSLLNNESNCEKVDRYTQRIQALRQTMGPYGFRSKALSDLVTAWVVALDDYIAALVDDLAACRDKQPPLERVKTTSKILTQRFDQILAVCKQERS
jgi:hypothetical protein